MARIAGTNVSYGNPDLHQRIADEDLAMSMPLGTPSNIDNQLVSKLANQGQAQIGRGFVDTPQQKTIAQSQGQVFNDYSAILQAQRNIERQQALASRIPDRITQTPVSNAYTYQNFLAAPHLSTFGMTDLRDQMANALAAGGRPIFDTIQGKQLLMGVADAPTGYYGGKTYTGYGAYDPNRSIETDDDRQEVVLPEYDAKANAKRCPDGYVFDEQLQACRLATTIPNMPTTDRTAFYQQPYQPMGLLDQDGYEYGVPLIYG